MSFTTSAILLLLWLAPLPGLFILWSRRRQKRNAARLVHPSAFAGRPAQTSNVLFNAQLALILAGFVLLVIAAAGPRWGEREEIVAGNGRNVLILVDVSRSMLATDVRPNRLERAKADLTDLLSELHGDRAGIMAFRNGAALLCPFTTDLAFLNQTLAGLSIDSAPRGETDIGSAITAALNTFKNLGTDHNAIILISDGEDLSGKAVEKAAEAGRLGIPVFCVGIGDTAGAAIPDGQASLLRYRGEEVVTRLDNQTLLDIATASGGAYIPLQTAGTGRNTLGTLYNRHVKNILAQEMQNQRESRLIERFQVFLFPGLILLLVAAALSLGRPSRRRNASKIRTAATSASLLLALAPFAFAAPDIVSEPVSTSAVSVPSDGVVLPPQQNLSAHQLARMAQRFWKASDYVAAAGCYDEALAQRPMEPAFEKTLRFNAALAHLQAGNADQAAELFRTLAADPATGIEATEGLGVALFRAADALSAVDPNTADDAPGASSLHRADEKLKLLQDAASAFQLALRGLPADDLRRKNLAAALAEIPALREEARLSAIQKKYGKLSQEELITELLKQQRNVYAASAATFAHDTPEQIAQLEQAAEHQRTAADIWLPLREQLVAAAQSAITNQNQLADFIHRIDSAKDQAEGAAQALSNIDPAALDAMRKSESTALQLLHMTAAPPALLAESILAQSNALVRALDSAKPRMPIEDQRLSSGLFQLFADQYDPWLDQQQQSDGIAMPPDRTDTAFGGLSPEARAEIDDLVKRITGSQSLALMELSPSDTLLPDLARVNAEQALRDMLRIQELLPKPPSQQQQQQGDSQNQEDPNPQDQQEEPDQQDAEEKSEADPSDPQEEENQQPPEQQEEESSPSQDAPTEETPDQKEAERIMAQILEQEKQREEARRERIRTLPPRVGERDW